nr:unnamed protein product [Callosobruchus chinensis]
MDSTSIDIRIEKTTPECSRKRIVQRDKHKRVIAAKMRYSAKCLPEKPRCTHKTDLLKCNTLTMKELQFVHARFYEIPSKLKQDAFILKCCNAILPKRRRRREQREEGSTAYQKQVSIGYRIPKQGGEWIRICRSAFMKILDLKKDRIQGVVKRFFFEGQTPSENRGGDRVLGKNDKKKLAMSNFMESFKCCRSQVTRRTYLPCELNIRKLHKLYISSVEPFLTVKEHYFRSYFTTHYNIGFGTPITDACSVCLRHKENIKKEKDDERKNELNILQELHKLKAKAFYKMLKANRKEREVFSMDCQKNLALPKLPDQRAYFSSQYNFYNFSIVNGTANAKLNPETVTAYVWTDLDLPKNSSVIASALFHKLSNHNFSEKIKEIFIFADGCPGQNKNITEHYGPDWQTKSDLKFYKDAINFSLHNDESDPQLLLNELCTEFPPEEATGM